MGSITLRGREIPLTYTTYEMKLIQEDIAPLGDFQYIIYGRNKDDENDTSKFGGPEQLNAIAKLIRILGNAGLEENGEEANLDEKWILRSLKPGKLVEAVQICMAVMNEGMASEIPDKKKEGPVDVVLEEIEKKKVKES